MPLIKTITAASTLALCSGLAFAQTGPSPQQQMPGSSAFAYSAQQFAGTMQRFTLTPRGDLDGFVLSDGTVVHMPPHLSAQLAAAIRQGDPVVIRGYRLSGVPLIVATAATDTTTNQTVVDQGPPPLGFAPPSPPPGMPVPGAQQTSLNGRVQTLLYGPAGDVNGAVLEDGTIIRMPPWAALQSASLLSPGRSVTVQGWALSTPYGRVMEVQAINPA
jgi:hypothetical protein